MNNEIGVAIITCNRQALFDQCIDSINMHDIDKLIVVNDGNTLSHTPQCDEYIKNETNLGVCKSKNIAMKRLLDLGCKYIFIVEDDMIIKDNKVWQRYIDVSHRTGIHAMEFGSIDYANSTALIEVEDAELKLWENCCGAFTFFTSHALNTVGLLDERFNGNCWEHCEHTYILAKANLTTPFWAFADVNDSWKYLRNVGHGKSSIDNKHWKYQHAYNDGLKYFKEKHGTYIGDIPKPSTETIDNSLITMFNNRKESLQ